VEDQQRPPKVDVDDALIASTMKVDADEVLLASNIVDANTLAQK
jgi:hypothetical protein